MSKKHEYKRVFLPHIHYTVIFQDMDYLQMEGKKGAAYTIRFDEHTSYVFIESIKDTVAEPCNFPMLAHEMVHVLQNIVADRFMELTEEKEHTAYIMAHCLNELLGYRYNIVKGTVETKS